MRIGRFAVGEGGADLLREIDRQARWPWCATSRLVVPTCMGLHPARRGSGRDRGSSRSGLRSPSRPRSDAAVEHPRLDTVPVVLGGGKKLFNGSAPHSFQLTSSRVSPNGLIVGHYEREAQIKIGDTTLDSPSEREIARPERMKREG